MKKENVFIDLSKCSEEEIKSLPLILENESVYFDDKRLFKKGKYNLDYPLFYFSFSNQWISGDKTTNQKRSELTYPEFIKMFEGGEQDNNGWIKISDDNKPKFDLITEYWFYDGQEVWSDIFTLIMKIGNIKITHFKEKEIKPLPPPKF